MMFGVHSSQSDHFGKLYPSFWKFCTARECGSLNTNDFRKSTGAKDSIVGKKSMLHTGTFHGVDYGTRLVEFAV